MFGPGGSNSVGPQKILPSFIAFSEMGKAYKGFTVPLNAFFKLQVNSEGI